MLGKLFKRRQADREAQPPKLDAEAFRAREEQLMSRLDGSPQARFMAQVLMRATDFLISSGRIPPHEKQQ